MLALLFGQLKYKKTAKFIKNVPNNVINWQKNTITYFQLTTAILKVNDFYIDMVHNEKKYSYHKKRTARIIHIKQLHSYCSTQGTDLLIHRWLSLYTSYLYIAYMPYIIHRMKYTSHINTITIIVPNFNTGMKVKMNPFHAN